MKKHDRKAFAQTLAATFSVYGQSCTPEIIGVWWNALEGYRFDAVVAALSA